MIYVSGETGRRSTFDAAPTRRCLKRLPSGGWGAYDTAGGWV
jgi:hypothetical protein